MTTCVDFVALESELITKHNELVRRLDDEYTNHISKLLEQKSIVLGNLQKQFIERWNKIKDFILISPSKNYQDISENGNEENLLSCRDQHIEVEEEKSESVIESDSGSSQNVTIRSGLDMSNNPKRRSKRLANKIQPTVPTPSKPPPPPRNAGNDQRENKRKPRRKSRNISKSSKYKRHKCPHCEYSTDHSTNFKRHIRIHTGEKPFVCSFENCGKRFAQKGDLNGHIRRHIGDKRFKCCICDKSFVSSSELKLHNLTHTGEKPYKCKYCDKRFSQIPVKAHERNVHQKRKK